MYRSDRQSKLLTRAAAAVTRWLLQGEHHVCQAFIPIRVNLHQTSGQACSRSVPVTQAAPKHLFCSLCPRAHPSLASVLAAASKSSPAPGISMQTLGRRAADAHPRSSRWGKGFVFVRNQQPTSRARRSRCPWAPLKHANRARGGNYHNWLQKSCYGGDVKKQGKELLDLQRTD